MSTLEPYQTTMQSSVADQEMDMASDTEQGMHYGNEIDLDLDLNPEAVHAEDEDYVLEDATPEAHGLGEEVRDDIMYDEEEFGGMQQPTSPHDEELGDAVEETVHTERFDDFEYPAVDVSNPYQIQSLLGDGQPEPTEFNIDPLKAEFFVEEEAILDTGHSQLPVNVETESAFVSEAVINEQADHESTHDQESLENHYDTAATTDRAVPSERDQESEDVSRPVLAKSIEEDVQGDVTDITTPNSGHSRVAEVTDPEEHFEPTEIHSPGNQSSSLPTVILAYLDNEMSLFPPSNDEASSTYCLEDDSLSEQSFDILFQAIRLVLGESISDDENLRLHVHDLNLDLDEVSAHVREVSLLEIRHLHLQLQEHDGVHDLSPLHLTLTAQSNLLQRLRNLKEAVATGKGLKSVMSDLGFHAEQNTNESHEEDRQIVDTQTLEEDAAGSDSKDDKAEQNHDTSGLSTGAESESIKGVDELSATNQEATLRYHNEEVEGEDANQANEQQMNQKIHRESESAEVEQGRSDNQPLEEIDPTKESNDQNEDEIDGDLIDYSEDDEEIQRASADSQNHSSESSTLQGDDQSGANIPITVDKDSGHRARDSPVESERNEEKYAGDETEHGNNSIMDPEDDGSFNGSDEADELAQTDLNIENLPPTDLEYSQYEDANESFAVARDLHSADAENHDLDLDAREDAKETKSFVDQAELRTEDKDDIFDDELENVDFNQEEEYEYNSEDLATEADEIKYTKPRTFSKPANSVKSDLEIQRQLDSIKSIENGSIKRSRNDEPAERDDEEQELKRLRSS